MNASTIPDDVVEAVARALYGVGGRNNEPGHYPAAGFDELSKTGQDFWSDRARAALAASPLMECVVSLADCVKRLRMCAELGGNCPEAVDGLCEQFETVVARFQP